MRVLIISSFFVDLSKVGSGGAVSVSGKPLFVSFCFFTNLSVTIHGGSIYGNNTYSTILKTCFHQTYSTANKNDEGVGNAVCVQKGLLISSNINVRKCGISATLSSDSSVQTRACQTKVENYNSTSNYGTGGASGIAIHNCKTESSVKYMNVVDAHDNGVVESYNSVLYMIHSSNFVNTTGCLSCFLWEEADYKIKFDSCIFINTKITFSYMNRLFYAVNCISDSTISGMTVQSNPETIFITIRLMNICTIVRKNSSFASCFPNENMMIRIILSSAN